MKISSNLSRGARRAYALLMTMILVAAMLILYVSMTSWMSGGARVGQRNNQYLASEAAAEGATERVMASMMRDFLNQSFSNAAYYGSLYVPQTNADGSPWPIQYVFSDIYGNSNQISVLAGSPQSVLQPLGSQYANLEGYPCYYTNIATATPIGQPYPVSVTVTQVLNLSTIPLFQYAIFYNINLEIDPGAAMTVNGPVWSNGGLWAGAGDLTFNSTVSAVSNAFTTATDPFATGKSDATAPPKFLMAGQPSSGNTALVLPIGGATNSNPTNVESMLNIPPAPYQLGTAGGFSTNGQEYLANVADLIISNSAAGVSTSNPLGTNLFVYYLDQYLAPSSMILVPNDFYKLYVPGSCGLYTNWISKNTADAANCYTNVAYAGYSWLTNVSFYDYRESKIVQALQIDVGLMAAWMNPTSSIWKNSTNYGGWYYSSNLCFNDKGRYLGGVWAYNSVPMTSATLPAVRVTDGIQLPSNAGLTVVTPMPLYAKGDWNKQQNPTHVSSGTNTAYTYPSALMGDAVTVLSSAWSDSFSLANTGNGSLSSRVPVSTTINAAFLEGIVPSNPQISGNYSGGVENFIRFLENWGGTTTYNGSIVVMFPSIYATNYWSYGNYYTAPTRNWGFDYNFLNPNKLPLMTPMLKKTVRVSWSP